MRAFVCTDVSAFAAYTEAIGNMKRWRNTILADAEEMGLDPQSWVDYITGREEFTGFTIPDDGVVPEGWRIVKSRKTVEPERGDEGEAARAWVIAHASPGTPIHVLARDYGLNTMSQSERDKDGRHFVAHVQVHELGGDLYAVHAHDALNGWAGGESLSFDSVKMSDSMGPLWTEIKLSEYHAAREAAGV